MNIIYLLGICRHIVFNLIVLSIGQMCWAQTDDEIRVRANKLFEEEEYVSATADFLHLLSLNPMEHDLNFKYGACLLYNSTSKQQAIRYLNFAVLNTSVDPRAYYFRGKAYHLNFEFEEAKKNYKNYLTKRTKEDSRYTVEREMAMCDNGKRLLTTFTDIIVADKKEIDSDKFFRIYSDSKTIGGQILVTEQFQSKMDKKMGHIPIVHFPPSAKAIYYSSYGETTATGLDIYVRRRLPDGSWGNPQLLPGGVNTSEDEDFPYMHPSGNFLYFSSTGHNSMGGYDIFMSRLNSETNAFGTPENVDFAISSPDDDFFYVVDSLFQNAYFASARQSSDGNLHVYKVKVARVPIQEVIVMGDFLSEINPENKAMSIALASHTNGNSVGEVKTNQAGKYSFVFPQGGKYDYLIKVEGVDEEYKFTVELPFLEEFRPLKQRIKHINENGKEVVKLYNLFDEEVEGSEALLAEIIRKKSELDVNIDKFDVEAIETANKEKEILASIGFENMSLTEVSYALNEIKENSEDYSVVSDRVESNIDTEIVAKSERVETLAKLEEELLSNAAKTSDPVTKHKLLNEAKKKAEEKETLLSSIQTLVDLKEIANTNIGLPESDVKQIAKVVNQFNDAKEIGNDTEALQILVDNREVLIKASEGSPDGVIQQLVADTKKSREEISKLTTRIENYETEIERLNRDINALKSQLSVAKKKDVETLETQIREKEAELDLVKKEQANSRLKIVELNRKLSALDVQITSLQNAMETEQAETVDQRLVQDAMAVVNEELANPEKIDYEKEISDIENKNPELFGIVEKNPAVVINKTKEQEDANVTNDPNLTELEQKYALIENNNTAIEQATTQLDEIENGLVTDPENPELKEKQSQLTTYIEKLSDENKQYDAEASALKSETPDAAMTSDDIVKEISPNYTKEIASIVSNNELDDREKLTSIKAVQEAFISDARNESEKVKDAIAKDPENSELKVRQEMLAEILMNAESELAETEKRIAELPVEVAITKTIAPTDIIDDFDTKVAAIEDDNSLTPSEKATRLKVQDEALLEAVNKEQAKLEKKIKKNPEDQELIDERKALNELAEVTQSSIDEKTQTILALTNQETDTIPDVVVDVEVKSEEQIMASINPDYNKEKEELKKEAKKSKKGVVSLLELETEMFNGLQETKAKLEGELASDPNNEQLTKELEVVTTAIDNQRRNVTEVQDVLLEQMDETERARVISSVDPTYLVDMESLIDNGASTDEKIDREVELQMAIGQKIAEIEEKQKRGYTIQVEYEEKQLKKLLTDSQNREQKLRQETETIAVVDPAVQQEFIKEIRGENTIRIDDEFFDLEELKTQSSELATYEAKLDELIADTQKKNQKNPTDQLSNELKWLNEEKAEVAAKRRKVSIQIGELETSVADNNTPDTVDESKIVELKNEQEQIETDLRNENLTKSERKELDEKLSENLTKQMVVENERLTESISNEEKETADLKTELLKQGADEGIAKTTSEMIADEEAAIAILEEKAEESNTEEERNFLLRDAEQKRVALNNETKEILDEINLSKLEEEQGVSVVGREELEQKKRTFTVRIGEISNEIVAKENEKTEAKRKDIPAIDEEIKRLTDERNVLIQRLAEVDNKLEQQDEIAPLIDPLALDEQISFNEERKIASTEEYADYENLASEALSVENQIRTLEEALKEEKKAIAEIVSAEGLSSSNEELGLRIEKVKEIEREIDQLNIELTQKKWESEQVLPTDREEAMKMQNLVTRGIKPIKTTLVATAILQLPSAGFAVDTNSTSIYTATNPIPVNVESPSGLVYRVQIGAFAKPIPQDLFKEFNPVSGEKMEGSNITRYMAGFFNSSNAVVDAREKIRGLGYGDAFVVAYCDGERITFGEARRREEAGTCVPKGASELMVEVAEKTAEKLGIPLTTAVVEVAEMDYNKAPGAVPADPIEVLKGLFFTVQIGVFNRPASDENLHFMQEVNTLRLPNGQIRYSSGRFDSVEEALPRKTLAVSKGINGAFVTAYYNGERIPLGQAKKLLETNGRSILQSEMDKKRTPAEIEVEIDPRYKVEVDTTDTEVIAINEVNPLRVQVVSKKSFEEFPRDVLNRYNAEGSFYYDIEDKKVKSIIYKNEDYLPRLYNFVDDIDTVFIPAGRMEDEGSKIVEIVFSDSIIPGDFMDKMLRFNYRREMKTTEKGIEVRLFGIKEQILEGVLNELKEFGVLPEVKEETEFELELNENR